MNSAGIAGPHVSLEIGLGNVRTADWAPLLKQPAQWDVATVLAQALLDRVQQTLDRSPTDVRPAMTELFDGLSALRASAPTEVWHGVMEQCKRHPVLGAIHQEPFTARTFNKPRGYAGDAVMIDYIYTRDCRNSEADAVTRLGEQLFAFIRDTPACAAVRARRDIVAGALDEMCERVHRPRILSVACGHLREAGLSRAVRANRAGEIVALDADALSLQVIATSEYGVNVKTVCNSIKGLFRGPVADEKFDFVYSTGLYDYLDERMATRLTHRMFDMLNPGGRLLVANFLPDIWCAGYMETFMDWKLVYRDAAQMNALASTIPAGQIKASRTFLERNNNIIFLELNKA